MTLSLQSVMVCMIFLKWLINKSMGKSCSDTEPALKSDTKFCFGTVKDIILHAVVECWVTF